MSAAVGAAPQLHDEFVKYAPLLPGKHLGQDINTSEARVEAEQAGHLLFTDMVGFTSFSEHSGALRDLEYHTAPGRTGEKLGRKYSPGVALSVTASRCDRAAVWCCRRPVTKCSAAISVNAARPRSFTRRRKDKGWTRSWPRWRGWRPWRSRWWWRLRFGLRELSGLGCYLMHSDLRMESLRSNRWWGTEPDR